MRTETRACQILRGDMNERLARANACRADEEEVFLRAQLGKRMACVEMMAEALAGCWPDGTAVELNHRDRPQMFILIMFRDHEYDMRDLDFAVSRAFAIRRDRASWNRRSGADETVGGFEGDCSAVRMRRQPFPTGGLGSQPALERRSADVTARRDGISNSHRPTMTWIDSAPPSPTDGGGALPFPRSGASPSPGKATGSSYHTPASGLPVVPFHGALR